MWSDLLPLDPAAMLFPAAPLLLLLAALLTFRRPATARRLAGGLCLPVGLLAVAAVPADPLGGLMLAWAATDVFLHGLLTFFRERPAAVLAARKRLLAVGAANGLLLAGSVWLHARFGTFALDGLAQAIAAPGGQDGLTGPALLITLGVILKSAQLPVHGWILQVMEAPTPVSALLHAGIVNIGGFVLLRLTGLLEAAPVAQALLVTVGGLSAGLAALVMMTRVSVKVMLAWSTCAQMGFMLLEIGLGAYPLALLHLLAHSLYKAHAFLAAGGTARRLTRLPAPRATGPLPLAGLGVGLTGLAVIAGLAGLDPREEPALVVLGLALLTGLVPLLRDAAVATLTVRWRLAGAALGLVLAYALWHHLFAAVLPLAAATPSAVWLALPALGLVLLLIVQETVIARPDHAPAAAPRLRLTDWLEAAAGEGKGLSLTAVVTHAIGQHCASWFDHGQALWRPASDAGLYAAWRRTTAHDHGLSLLTGIPGIAARLAALPEDPEQLLADACRALRPGAPERYFTALLLSVNGWAGWCAGLAWRARQQGGSDDSLRQLLAMRLAWDWVLADLAGDDALRAAWRRALAEDDAPLDDTPWIWQDALEIAWQAGVNAGLARAEPATAPGRPPLEAVFCIDVRSEPLRRALEAQQPGIRTHGFAGFFGLPIDYLPPGGDVARPQLPGLLAPSLRVTAIAGSEAGTAGLRDGIRARLMRERSWQDYRTSAGGGFGFVEALGLGYLWKLLRDTLGGSAPEHPDGLTAAEAAQLQPVLEGVSLDQAAELAATVLAAMSLPRDLAPWVLLTGHGSGTVNNPHAAGLDCGACCGQTGEVNARVLASILNDPGVRARLAARGVELPADIRFIAALHDTVTDEITLYDQPSGRSGADDLTAVRQWLAAASARTRRERAPALGLADNDDAALATALRRRGRDWSEVRPEWGLANNAGFIAAPRERTRQLDLRGRCFLHDYDVARDPDYQVLELILTAPVVVAHWINLQYYASTVDNRRWGSGDKVLHNIVGGNIGVFEGNGGDLRTGLPLQCLHDGQRWRHTPLRLTVWLEAPCAAVDAILARHENVRALVEGGWLHLACIEPGGGRVFQRLRVESGAVWRPVVEAACSLPH